MSTLYQLDFERDIRRIEQQIEAAEARPQATGEPPLPPGVPPPPAPDEPPEVPLADLPAHIDALKEQLRDATRQVYSELSPWDTVRVARHPLRPQTRDYIQLLARDF